MIKNDYCEIKLSVIVAVYNGQAYLERCLDSILNSTYKNIEIIIVNDGSCDNTENIIKKYVCDYKNIKYVKHEKNRGCYAARISGYENSSGDYIAFVDSDDYVGVDFFRLMIKSALKNNYDIVVGRTIWDYGDRKIIYNLAEISGKFLDNGSTIENYFSQAGKNMFYYVVWNKIYSRRLWDKCIDLLKSLDKKVIMCEDVVFCSVLFCFTERIVYENHEGYFYFKHGASETSMVNNGKEVILRKLNNISTCFDFIENFLVEIKLFDEFKIDLVNWKKDILAGYFCNDFVFSCLNKKIINKLLRNDIDINDVRDKTKINNFFYSVESDWDNRFELLKSKLIKDDIKYVSFDVFDTLILRPFEKPKDLFILLNDFFKEICGFDSLVNFNEIRESAEIMARKKLHSKQEDINIKDIYDYISDEFDIDKNVCEKLMQKEIELELKFCYRRKSIFEIYELAKSLGKKIIVISDMYLSKDVIKKILDKNGYDEIENIFVSCDYKTGKFSGGVYNTVRKKLGLKKNMVLHIGDNYESDYKMAVKNNFQAFYFPKALDAMNLKTNGILDNLFYVPKGEMLNIAHGQYFFVMRCIKALIANYYFDNPFVNFIYDSDYNCDPKLIGYAVLGSSMLGIIKWLLDDLEKQDYDKIQFLARDGYLAKKIYDKMAKLYKNAPESGYFYMSRKSLMPFLVKNKYDLYQIHNVINIGVRTPREIIKYIFKYDRLDYIFDILKKNNIALDEKFYSKEEYYRFCSVIIKNIFDQGDMRKYSSMNKNILNMFKENFKGKTATFDIGCIARPQVILSRILNQPIDAYFVHTNSDETSNNAKTGKFVVKSFYDYTPSVMGQIREYFISQMSESCIGYDDTGKPVFENFKPSFIESFIINNMQTSAIKFIDDFIYFFGDYYKDLNFRCQDLNFLLDNYLNHPKQIDMLVFKECYFYDEVSNGINRSRGNIFEYWQKSLIQNGLAEINRSTFWADKNIIYKFIFYFILDRKTCKERVYAHLLKYPFILNSLRYTYKSLRAIKNFALNIKHKNRH